MIPNPVGSNGTDIATVGTLVIAALGFLFGALKTTRTGDRVDDLVKQRDEARADLDDAERRCRALERAIEKLENGGGK